jgi:lipoyl(octanoyl) transferase
MQGKNQQSVKKNDFPSLKRVGDAHIPEKLFADDWVAYPQALEAMELRVQGILDGTRDELLWFLEHPHLYTLGRSGAPQEVLREDVPLFETGRGGKATYHGPGQRVVYILLDLRARGQDLRAYVWSLEEWLIRVLEHLGIQAERRPGRVGLWVTHEGFEKKIAAIGVRVRGWVTYHGIALNVSPDLSYFQGIVPCGLAQYGVTSVQELIYCTDMARVDQALQVSFSDIF